MAKVVVTTKNLTKYYGNTRGVESLDLEINEGEVFGYLGPNGAGKTTTIRMLLDLIRPTSGQASIFGLSTSTDTVKIKKRIGYLPGELELYKNMSGSDLIHYFAALRGGVDWNLVLQLAERFKYDMKKPVKTLSSGNKHKLGLIQAFMHSPELLILDEPTTGLDPLMQQEFYRLIQEVKKEGRTILLSSHNLPEVERICDRVGVIRDGRLITVENVSELKSKAVRTLEIHFASQVTAADFDNLEGISELKAEGRVVRCTVKGSLDGLVKRAARFEVVDLISHEPDLEETFLAYYGGLAN